LIEGKAGEVNPLAMKEMWLHQEMTLHDAKPERLEMA